MALKIKITAGGIFGKDGEVKVGTEFVVQEEPKGWAGRYQVMGEVDEDIAVAVQNTGGGEGSDDDDGSDPAPTITVEELGKMDKAALLDFAKEQEIEVNARLGEEKLRDAIIEALQANE